MYYLWKVRGVSIKIITNAVMGQILYRLSSNYSLPALNSEQKKYSTEIIKA